MFAVTLALVSFVPAASPRGAAVDTYGDPLPAGAVARLGSVRWRCPDAPDHLIWSPDGKYLVGTHGGKSLTIWAYPAGVAVGRFTMPQILRHRPSKLPDLFMPTLTPEQVRFAPDGRSMLVYGGWNQLYRVRVPDGSWERINTGSHTGTAVAISADGRRLLMETHDARSVGQQSSELSWIDLDRPGRANALWTRRVTKTDALKAGRRPAPNDTHMTADGRFVIASAVQNDSKRFAFLDLETSRRWVSPPDLFDHVRIMADGTSILTGKFDGHLARWRFNRGEAAAPASPVVVPEAQTENAGYGPFAVSPDGRRIVCLSQGAPSKDNWSEETLSVRDGQTLRLNREWPYRNASGAGAWSGLREDQAEPARWMTSLAAAAVAADSRTLAIVWGGSRHVRFFDIVTGEERPPFVGHTAGVKTLRATTSGRTLASVGFEQAGRSWDLSRLWSDPRPHGVGRESTSLGFLNEDDLPPPVRPRVPPKIKVIYDRDRNRLEGRLAESEQLVWDEAVPALTKVPAADRPGSLPDASDRDGVMVALAIGDTITVRDPITGESLMTFRVPGSRPTAVEFIPDTTLLAAGYDDGQVLLWDLWPADLPRRPPTDTEMARLWADLAGGPRDALRARMVLLAHPEAAVRGLKEHVRGLARPTEFEIDQWLAELSHKRYAVREKATRALARHFDVSEKAARDMLAVTRSPEVEQRLKAVLAAGTVPDGDGAVAQLVRIVGVLEQIGTADARDLLFRVARGSGLPAVRATDALARLRDRKPASGTAGKRPMSVIVGKAANSAKAATRWQPSE